MQVTIEKFQQYLESMNLDHSNIVETESAFEATVFWQPRIYNFTQVLLKSDETWWVRLAKVDLQNESITNGFFA